MTRLAFADPKVAISFSPRWRPDKDGYRGNCPLCGKKNTFTANWTDDGGRTVVNCFEATCSRNFLGFYHERGLWLSPIGGENGGRLLPAKVEIGWTWEAVSSFACTSIERQVDMIIGGVEPDERGRRLITLEEIRAKLGAKQNGSRRHVAMALRVLEALGRWRKVKIPFERKGWPGRAFWRNGFVEIEDWDCFLPLVWEDLGRQTFSATLPEGWWDTAIENARKEAKEARNYRLQRPGECN
jgi:hypothetical protein